MLFDGLTFVSLVVLGIKIQIKSFYEEITYSNGVASQVRDHMQELLQGSIRPLASALHITGLWLFTRVHYLNIDTQQQAQIV